MAGTSLSSSKAANASEFKIRVRYGRLSLALVGLLAVLATVVGAIIAPFTALTFGWVGIFFLVGIGSFASLRVLAVMDRNRKLLANLEATRERAMQTPAMEDELNQVAARKETSDEVFDARPGSNRKAPAITAEELRAEALRVAHGLGGVKQPETWTPTQVPSPTYVKVRENTQREIAARLNLEPIPVSEPLRPTKQVSLKASEQAKRIATEVSAEDKAAVASVVQKRASETTQETAAEKVEAPAKATAEIEKPMLEKPTLDKPVPPKNRLNLDDVMQRRRA